MCPRRGVQFDSAHCQWYLSGYSRSYLLLTTRFARKLIVNLLENRQCPAVEKEEKDWEREEPNAIERFFATTSRESPSQPFAVWRAEEESSASPDSSTKRPEEF